MEAINLNASNLEPTTEDLVTRIPTLLGQEDIARWKEELLRQFAHEGTADYVLKTDAEVIKDRHVSVCITAVLLLGTTLFFERLERAGWCFEQTLNKDPKEYYDFTFADLVASAPGIGDGPPEVRRFFEKAAERRGTKILHGSKPPCCYQCQLKYRVYVGPGHLSGSDLHRLDVGDLEALLVAKEMINGYVAKYIARDTDQALRVYREAHKYHPELNRWPHRAVGRPDEAIRRPDGAVGRPGEAVRRPDEDVRRPGEAILRLIEAARMPVEAMRRPNEIIRSRWYDNDTVIGCIFLFIFAIFAMLLLLHFAPTPSSQMSAPLVPLRQPFRFV
ncbi:hypothetical protein GE09DRAFT_1228683 [Coniochaeta sp. 2T2.1]|nr:hypothetical protein GE09DRAFT_1228683 [Coniochaeta sp. 2T2.1]